MFRTLHACGELRISDQISWGGVRLECNTAMGELYFIDLRIHGITNWCNGKPRGSIERAVVGREIRYSEMTGTDKRSDFALEINIPCRH